MMRATLLIFPLLTLIAGFSGPATAEQSAVQQDMKFVPPSLVLKVGETVKFLNGDHVTHDLSIRNPDGSHLTSAMEKPGDAVTITFDHPGDYKVQCLIHPMMKMTVTVE